ncbi:MAG: hydantoinase B/oxoprolinase family protein, partial [bacterium]
GGLGIRREIRAVGHVARVSLRTDRRSRAPYGVRGGGAGAVGRNVLLRANGQEEPLPSKGSIILSPGEALSVETPGGGGWGDPAERSLELIERDRREERI